MSPWQKPEQRPTSNGAEPRGEELDVSLLVLGLRASAGGAPVLESLRRQASPVPRFETIRVERVDARSLNEAAAAARGRLLVFVAPDVTLAADALALHVRAHAASTTPAIVLGALDREGLSLRPLAWSLERLGLLGWQHAPEESGEIPAECLAFDHASVRRSELLRVGGFDEALSVFGAIELGARLAKAGGRLLVDPAIRATRPAALDLDGWLARARAMGADWLLLRRRYGNDAPPRWLHEVGLEASAVELLLAAQLAATGAHARRVEALRETLHELEVVLARDPARADATLAAVGEDLGQVVLAVTRHELARGFVHAAQGGEAPALERCATQTRRGAAVLVTASDLAASVVEKTLGHLPASAELVAAVPANAAAPTLPDDSRLIRLALPGSATNGAMRRALLDASGADYFVLLDGSRAPMPAEWEAVRLTLSALPSIGACGVAGENAGRTTARLTTSVPTWLVATRRDVIESDGDDQGPFLERIVRRGLRLATARAAAPAPEPAACSV